MLLLIGLGNTAVIAMVTVLLHHLGYPQMMWLFAPYTVGLTAVLNMYGRCDSGYKMFVYASTGALMSFGVTAVVEGFAFPSAYTLLGASILCVGVASQWYALGVRSFYASESS